MGRGVGGEAPAGYFTLNYYSPPTKKKKFNQMSACAADRIICLRRTSVPICRPSIVKHYLHDRWADR
jgi:hypothetical protein